MVLFAVYLFLALISPRSLGMGDVKLAGLLGLFLGWLGWDAVVVGAAAGFVVQALVALVLLAGRRIGLRSELPFGPAMLLGAALAIAAGDLLPALNVVSDYPASLIGPCRSPVGRAVSAVRVENPQVAARLLPTGPPQPRGRVSRPGPDGRHLREHHMINLYASLVSLVSLAQDRVRREEKGATAVEYGLMVGLIAVAIIGDRRPPRRPARRPVHQTGDRRPAVIRSGTSSSRSRLYRRSGPRCGGRCAAAHEHQRTTPAHPDPAHPGRHTRKAVEQT